MRLFVYEFRKLFDTRSSKMVIAACVLAAVGLGAVGLFVRAVAHAVDLSEMAAASVLPFAIVAPILGVLTAASDWSSGFVQQTLFIEPRRQRLFVAKGCAALAAALSTSLVAIALSFTTGLVVGLAGHLTIAVGGVAEMLWGVFSLVLPRALLGFGLGALLLSTPLAVALVLVTQLVVDVALSTIPGGAGIFLMSATFPNWLASGAEPLAALSSAVVWILVPLVLGYVRYCRHEAAS